jgi:hypothetical protein
VGLSLKIHGRDPFLSCTPFRFFSVFLLCFGLWGAKETWYFGYSAYYSFSFQCLVCLWVSAGAMHAYQGFSAGPDMALNLAPFDCWTLRDKAALTPSHSRLSFS